MVKLDKKLCPFEGCFTSASYGVVGEKRKYCAAHAQQGMVSIGGRRCAKEDCSKRANYGVAGTNKREFCAGHAGPGMVNINIKHGGRRTFLSSARRSGRDSRTSNISNIIPASSTRQRNSPKPVQALAGGGGNPVAVGYKDGMRPAFMTGAGMVPHGGIGGDVGGGGDGGPFFCAVQGCSGMPTGVPNEKGFRFCEKHAILESVKQERLHKPQLQGRYVHQVRNLAPESSRMFSGTPPMSDEHSDDNHQPIEDEGTALEAHDTYEIRRPRDVATGVSSDSLAGAKQAATRSAKPAVGGGRNLNSAASAAEAEEGVDGGGREVVESVGFRPQRVMLPWPKSKSAPLLLTASGWTKYDWQPVVMDVPP